MHLLTSRVCCYSVVQLLKCARFIVFLMCCFIDVDHCGFLSITARIIWSTQRLFY